MSFEAVLYSHLTEDATLAGLIGDRLFPNLIPVNEEHPAVAYQLLDIDKTESHQGQGYLIFASYQFSIQDTTHTGAIAVETALINALAGWSGVDGDYKIIRCPLESAQDGYNLSGEFSTRRARFEIEYIERT